MRHSWNRCKSNQGARCPIDLRFPADMKTPQKLQKPSRLSKGVFPLGHHWLMTVHSEDLIEKKNEKKNSHMQFQPNFIRTTYIFIWRMRGLGMVSRRRHQKVWRCQSNKGWASRLTGAGHLTGSGSWCRRHLEGKTWTTVGMTWKTIGATTTGTVFCCMLSV